MHDALLSRFRGAYLGAALGEQIGAEARARAVPAANALLRSQPSGPVLFPNWRLDRPAFWIGQMLDQTQMLLDAGMAVSQAGDASRDRAVPELFMARLLPLALRHHDQPQVLRHHLAQSWPQSGTQNGTAPYSSTGSPDFNASEFWAALIMGQAISLILRERFAPQTLIPQMLRDLDLPDLPAIAPLLSQLTVVQTWLSQAADLATVARRLQSDLEAELSASSAQNSAESKPSSLFGPMALGLVLYSFLSSTEDVQAMLLRFARLQATLAGGSSELAGAVLGGLAGLYGGLPSLPLSWRQQLQVERPDDLAEAVLFQQADRLLAQWSGVAPGANGWLSQPHTAITAAPRVIQAGPDGR